jgi:hypothetical protein
VQLGGKQEIRIRVASDLCPELCQFGLYVPVERGVDLDQIKAARDNFQGMLFTPRHARRVQDAFPVFVRPASRTDADLTTCEHLLI